MARSPLTFQSAFDDVCAALGYTPAQIAANAALQSKLLKIFNRSYQVGYDLPGAGWEDARTGAEITPVDGLIDFATLGDAREWVVWSADPRSHEDFARRVSFTTNLNGILISEAGLDTVWVEWMPEVVSFVTTEWTAATYAVGDKRLNDGRCYRSLVSHTGAVFADDLAAANWLLMPVLGILHEFLIQHSHGVYLTENGQPETGYRMMGSAKRDLSELAVREMDRATRNAS